MKRKIVLLGHLFIYNIIMQQSFCQADQFGKMIYTTPPGWKASKYSDGVGLMPAQMPANEKLFLQIFPALNVPGTLEQALERSYDEACAILQATKMREVSGGNYTITEPKKSFKGWEYIRCSGGVKVNNGTPYPPEYGLDLFVIKINNRFERIATVKSRNTCGGFSRYYPSDRLSYRKAIEEFLFSLKFEDWREPVVKAGTIKGGDVVSAWQGLGLTVGTSGAAIKVQQLILFSNGQVFYGKNFPLEGLDDFNTWIAAENNRRDWGTYSINSGRVILKMPYGEIPARMDNNKLILTTNKTDHGFIKMSQVDGTTFNGTYVLSEWNGKIPSITFSSDGRFTDNGAIRVLYHEYVDCINEALVPGPGRYEIKNHTILFRYTDGRLIKIAITGSGINKNISNPGAISLSFNEDELRRQ